MSPAISIVLPVFNSEKFIADSIQSLINQTFTDFELIIIDDGSKDQSVSIIKSFKDSRIQLVQNDKNRGIAFSRNMGLKMAKGKYYAPFDSDDLALPEKLEKQFNFLEKHTEFGMIGSWARLIDANGKFLKTKWKLSANPETIPSILLFKNYFAQPALLIRKTAIPEGGYSPHLEIGEDYLMWFDIAGRWKVWNLPEYLINIRINPESITRKDSKKALIFEHQVIRNIFSLVGMELTIEQVERLIMIKNHEPIRNFNDLKIIEDLLNSIIIHNSAVKHFDLRELKKIVLNRWLKACFKTEGILPETIGLILTSKLTRSFFLK